MTSPQDLDRLSAYLDNSLSPADRARLEDRLGREPELRAALNDLRVTVRLLRALPTLKPPRNFTLTAAQAEAIRRPRGLQLFPALRLATALATLLFAAVLAADFGGGLLSRGAAAPEPAQVQSLAAEATTAPTLAVQQEVAAAPPTEAPAGAAAAETEALASKVAEASETATPEFTLAASAATAPADVGGNLIAATPAPAATGASLDAARAMTVTTETPVAVAEAARAASPTETLAALPAEVPALAPATTPPIRYVEIGLGALVVLLAVAAWLARRAP